MLASCTEHLWRQNIKSYLVYYKNNRSLRAKQANAKSPSSDSPCLLLCTATRCTETKPQLTHTLIFSSSLLPFVLVPNFFFYPSGSRSVNIELHKLPFTVQLRRNDMSFVYTVTTDLALFSMRRPHRHRGCLTSMIGGNDSFTWRTKHTNYALVAKVKM